jgi:hypothetical protein
VVDDLRMRLFSITVAIVACGACGGAPKPVTPAPTAATPVAATPQVAPAALPENIPDTPTGRQLAWVLNVLDAKHGEVTRDEVEAHFARDFLEHVPAIQTIVIFSKLGPDFAGARVVEAKQDGPALTARIESKTARYRAVIALGPDGLIMGLRFAPIGAESYDELAAALGKVAPKTALLVAQLDGATCKPLHAIHETDELAIGSAFKLYVLLALADQIERGKLKWDQELAVRDDWKSLPSGKTQNDAAGTKLTIREFANRMISISDNTATDHLLYTVGRKNAEAALHTAHHAQPLLDVPFLGTRELFVFKTLLTPDEIAKYLALKASPRRAYLDGPLAKRMPTLADAPDWKTARHIEDLEWFASPMDLCGAMAALEDRAAKVPEVRDVLAINPGIPLAPATWKYVGFKGGSEPGVLSGTWLLHRDDGKSFVVSIEANDPTGPEIDVKRAFELASAAIDLLAKEAR